MFCRFHFCVRPPVLGFQPHGDEKIATVGLYGAKKVIAFTKAFLKSRKEASKDEAAESSAVVEEVDEEEEATNDDDQHEDQEGDETAATAVCRIQAGKLFVSFSIYVSRGTCGASTQKARLLAFFPWRVATPLLPNRAGVRMLWQDSFGV